MKIELTPRQEEQLAEFKAFTNKEIVPYAEQFDREERVPLELIQQLARKKYLGAILPQDVGGLGADMITFGLLNEEIGRGCSSVRSLLTVHSMVAHAILRWGSQRQKETWLPELAAGKIIGAFALTEPNIGSDAQSVETTATEQNDSYVLN